MKKRFLGVCAVVLLVAGCQSQAPPDDEDQAPEGGQAAEAPEEEVNVAKPREGRIVLTEANFDNEVLASDKPVLVDFFATWCGPCQQMAPIVEELADEFQGRVVVGQLDVDQQRAIAMRYEIAGIPTFVLFKDGREVKRLVGGMTKEDLARVLDRAADN